jgi:hypothetical protein
MARTHPSEDEKAAYLIQHLPYEQWMLRVTFNAIHGGARTQLEWNIVYEAFIVHTRNLLDFLCGPRSDNELRITDFGQEKKNAPIVIRRTYGELHDAVLHLGYRRPSAAEDKISLARCVTVFEWLDPAFKEFVEALTPAQAQHWHQLSP